MKIPLRLLKKIIRQFEDTIYHDSENSVTVPVMVAMSDVINSEVTVHDLVFERDGADSEWALTGITKVGGL